MFTSYYHPSPERPRQPSPKSPTSASSFWHKLPLRYSFSPGPLPTPPVVQPEQPSSSKSRKNPPGEAVEHARPGRSGREYLASIGPSVESLSLASPEKRPGGSANGSKGTSKPLPTLPSSHTPAKPPSQARLEDYYGNWHLSGPGGNNRLDQSAGGAETHAPRHYASTSLLSPPKITATHRPRSDPVISPSRKPNPKQNAKGKGKAKATQAKHVESRHSIIDLSLLSSDESDFSSSSESSSDHRTITPRSRARQKRANSEQPTNLSPLKPAATRRRSRASLSPYPTAPNPGSSTPTPAVQCSGFTRNGQPCKRLVKAAAPYLTVMDGSVALMGGDSDEELERYCKDHAGMICQTNGFYCKEQRGLWIEFEAWIPPELGQQTHALLRMTMESKLTAKESPGFIYAYELRDLQTPTTCFYKVGRTENVPRRIGEWKNRCQSHTPTLRDIFPNPPASHNGATRHSFLPGATRAGTMSSAVPCLAVKRWEKLIHLELAEISNRDRQEDFKRLREKCADCGTSHREIFAFPRDHIAEGSYTVVVEVIERWQRFIEHICGT